MSGTIAAVGLYIEWKIMLRQTLEAVVEWLKRVVTQPREELDRWQKAARSAYDLGRFGARQLQHDRAPQMAAALAFRTLFGLLPVLVAGTVLVNATGLEEGFLQPLVRLFHFWGLDHVQVLAPTSGSQPSMTLADWLAERVRETEQINWAAVGWVGVAVTLYAAIGQMVTIENSFNIIYRAPQGRPWAIRIPLYWFALTLSPVAIVGSAYVSDFFDKWDDALAGQAWLATSIGVVWSLLSIWVIMWFVYLLLPNTRVRLRPAMAGALIAAVLLEIGKRTMGIYLSKALSVSQLYGSLGLVPLFIFWVYLMWLAVLFGLQVSSTLQHLHGRRLDELERQRAESTFVEASVVLVLMHGIASRFREGRSSNIEQLAQAAGIGEVVVERIVQQLVAAGLLHRLADEQHAVSMAAPPEQVLVDGLLDIAFQSAQRPIVSDNANLELTLVRLRSAQRESVAGLSLADLMA
ncbi:MAG: YihY family inner membrane protein [Planctomycetes bacterium]|nr:YihY family inner membrane protein [Planctomycetota bacterium]